MPTQHFQLKVHAPPLEVFNISRDVGAHLHSTAHTGEKVVSSRQAGLLEPLEEITWQARHLGVVQRLTVRITDFDPPHYFADEMVKGAFASFRHEHYFDPLPDGSTLMREVFTYRSPIGPLGHLADFLFLKRYMRKFLWKRMLLLKEMAEDKGVIN